MALPEPSILILITKDTVSTKMYVKQGDFDTVISHSLMAMSLGAPLIVFIYLNLFAFPEYLHMLVTSIVMKNS